jgi:ketosteroid isomerase-like protein
MGLLMRATLSLLLSFAAVGACSSEAVEPPPKPPVGSLDAVRVVGPSVDTVTAKERALPNLYANALSSQPGDTTAPFAQLAPLLNPDVAGFQSPGMSPVHDPAAIVEAHGKLFGAFDDRKMTLTRIWRSPSEQTLEWVMSGTQARPWAGVAPTHRRVVFQGVTLLWTKDDGSLTDIHVYFDAALVKGELGAGPKDVEAAAAALPEVPASKPQEFDQTGPTDDNKNADLVKGALDALENNKEAEYVGAMADNLEVKTQERVAAAKGKAEAKAYYRAMHKAIGQLDTTVMGAWSVGSYAIVEYAIAGEQLGPIMWIPAARDRVVRWEVVDICEIRDGKIGHVWRYDNPSQIAE